MRFLMTIVLGLAFVNGPAIGQACPETGPGLGQDWPAAARDVWYVTGTGSRLIPDAWYRALLRADDGTAFARRGNLIRYGFRFCGEMDRDPVGFTVDSDALRPPAIGLTCAACHTGQLTDGTRRFVVHGGAATIDVQSFTADLFASVLKLRSGPFETAVQTEDWLEFAGKVLGKDARPEAAQALHQEVSEWLQTRKDVQGSIHKGGEWGFGRQDAVMVTLNTVAALGEDNPGGLPAANSPVSFPALWLTTGMARLQWMGVVETTQVLPLPDTLNPGKLLRDVAETIGTYAEVTLPKPGAISGGGLAGMDSSVRLENLIRLDRALAQLSPPKWPREWGVIDRASADYKTGQALYSANCAQCHALPDLARPKAGQGTAVPPPGTTFLPILDVVTPPEDDGRAAIGTDPMAACNAFGHRILERGLVAATDVLAAYDSYTTLGAEKAQSSAFANDSPTLRVLADLSLRLVLGQQADLPDARVAPQVTSFLIWLAQTPQVTAAGVSDAGRVRKPAPLVADLDKVRKDCADRLTALRATNPATAAPGYKAAPLAGIFATAPYLHNGSVPTLDALISPPDARPDQFAVGDVLFDPVKVGLGDAIKGGAQGLFKVTDLRGREIAGNSNAGHVFPGVPLTEVQRAQLVLFLKGL